MTTETTPVSRPLAPARWLAAGVRVVRRLPVPSRRVLARLGLVVVLLWILAALGSAYSFRTLRAPLVPPVPPAGNTPELKSLLKEQKGLFAVLDKKVPRGKYIVIDKLNNRLWVREKDRLVREAVCSAGSGMVLRENGGGKRTWVFDTPMGGFKVLSKKKNPVWKKPDWAFVEEGKPIPKDPGERIEYGTLGEYALHFGNGYMIHGTLYERLLGRNVTHGCIRLGRDDLRFVYDAAPLGTSIYVF
jgi:L,D-transpeptidase YbiS